MSEHPPLHLENRIGRAAEPGGSSPDRVLKNFRYVIGSVDEEALRVWAELWKEFQQAVTTNGMVLPDAEQGFKPSCGWAEFLEKFWLLKHYLDNIHHLCQG
jgi:hypothetical protein